MRYQRLGHSQLRLVGPLKSKHRRPLERHTSDECCACNWVSSRSCHDSQSKPPQPELAMSGPMHMMGDGANMTKATSRA